MSEAIQRPLFYEGQVLSAADLKAGVDYGRGQAARDRRYLHTPGVATGLTLESQPRELGSDEYVDITLQPGVAIDATGLQIVLAESMRIDERGFEDARVFQATDEGRRAWHPVFLVGSEETAPTPPFSLGPCGSAEPTRIAEAAVIRFGRPADAADADRPPAIDVNQGPGGATDLPGVPVLLGFVQWDDRIGGTGRFTAVADEAEGVRRRGAGVLAEELAAPGPRLTLRSAPRTQGGRTAVVLDDHDGGQLRFGLQNAQGQVDAVLTVKANGDVEVSGKLSAKGDITSDGAIASTRAAVVIGSGVISDGLLVPLPAGITADMVDAGTVRLHIQLTPRYVPSNRHGLDRVMLPVECRVDGRRVSCRVRWEDLTAPAAVSLEPGVCDYTILVAPVQTGGTAP
jgi:hypothetical protein